MILSKIDFKKPRQKMWGIIKDNALVSLPYGRETDERGSVINGIVTNCYTDVLEEAKSLIAGGATTQNIQIVEFVPYDFMMQPTV